MDSACLTCGKPWRSDGDNVEEDEGKAAARGGEDDGRGLVR